MGLNKEVKNNLKVILLIIVTLFILYILHISIGGIFNTESGNKQEYSDVKIVFEKDAINRTLTVLELYSKGDNLYWSEISIVNGSANLPEGTIEIGDIITNCEGNLKLVHEKTGKIILEEDFS